MPISPYGHNDQGSPEEWAGYHARLKREADDKVKMENEMKNCQYCGSDYENGYDKDYCSEACWEVATNYGEDETE